MMNPLKTFQLYSTLRLSFNDGYDIRKYGVYNKRFNETQFSKCYFRYDCINFCEQNPQEERQKEIISSNLVRNPQTKLGEMKEDYSITLRRYKSSLQNYVEDCKEIFEKYKFRELLNKNNPIILDMLTSGEISPEWFVMTDKIIPISAILDEQDNFIWKIVKNRFTMYRTFVIIDSVESIKDIRQFIVSKNK